MTDVCNTVEIFRNTPTAFFYNSVIGCNIGNSNPQ